ncbi:hypothetical protein IPV09_10725 [Tessaracoccus sp. SD287]|uniref:hypothetical protein n=1 Tax=Tessaracoccus sp. SD287 TaxID=2782008 RepID=UPI001A9570AA|nr:hypothetical protein [Tessaracoccus sp. SD287]MBO1031807.1 hypothetical protein [Tessaracoccus sp. SD287]
MTTLLHPIGPEPEETYWKRRALVLGALVLVLLLLIWAISSLFNGSEDTGAVPVDQTTQGESSITTSSSLETPSIEPSGSGAASPSGSESEATDPSTAPSSPDTSTDATPDPTASPSTTSPATSSPATSAASSPATSTASPTGPVVCTAAEVVPGITGATRVNTGRTVDLKITLTSTKTCVIDFATASFEIRIYSGSDRIWSSNDCSTHQPKGRSTLAPGKMWGYTISWNTKRSLGDCKLDPSFLLPGTYVATAVLSGGEPVQHVMTVLA